MCNCVDTLQAMSEIIGHHTPFHPQGSAAEEAEELDVALGRIEEEAEEAEDEAPDRETCLRVSTAEHARKYNVSLGGSCVPWFTRHVRLGCAGICTCSYF